MKYCILILIIVFSIASHSQTPSQQKLIETIRKEFQSINKDSALKVTTLDAEDFLSNSPDGGAELKGYFRNSKLVKMYEWIGYSWGNRTREFYFKNGTLIFVYQKLEYFLQANDSVDHSKIGSTNQDRYYFNHGKIFHKIMGIPATTPGELLTIENELKAAAQERRKKFIQ